MNKTDVEIERKWIVNGWPDVDLPLVEEQRMRQGYISNVPVVRIREETCILQGQETKTDYILCFKTNQGLARTEIEIALSREDFSRLEKMIGLPLIEKIRRTYALPGGGGLEVNLVDEGSPSQMWYAEVEFTSLEEALAWNCGTAGLGSYLSREVTGEPDFSMGSYWIRTRKCR